jgi:hypothetical protein
VQVSDAARSRENTNAAALLLFQHFTLFHTLRHKSKHTGEK